MHTTNTYSPLQPNGSGHVTILPPLILPRGRSGGPGEVVVRHPSGRAVPLSARGLPRRLQNMLKQQQVLQQQKASMCR